MSTTRLIKLGPTILLAGYLGYGLYTLQPVQTGASEATQALERAVIDILAEGSEATQAIEAKVRDPFWAVPVAADALKHTAEVTANAAPDDPLAEAVRGLSLDATMIHGRDQIAVINGRIYNRGQSIILPGDGDPSERALKLLVVTRTGVTLRSGTKHYTLGYPDQLGRKKDDEEKPAAGDSATLAAMEDAGQAAMFQKLLNSPLGAMGRGIIGDPGRSKARKKGPAAARAGSNGQ
jgi:hypothetical protein